MTEITTESFLSEFSPVSTEEWERAIRADLKGADYAEKLIWHAGKDLEFKPYYRAEDLAGLSLLDSVPGDFPYIRGTRSSGSWRIREEIDAVDPEVANRLARIAVAAGAEEIAFRRVAVADASELGILLASLGEIPVYFENVSEETVCLLSERPNRRQQAGTLSADLDWSANIDSSAALLARAPAALVPFAIHAEGFQEGGATPVEEVGFAVASGVDFLAQMQDRGIGVDRAAPSVTFCFATGPEFFLQIAKLRAFRLLWARAVGAFNGGQDHGRARIYARTSRGNRTTQDRHTNILRGTTEAMCAVLGGADSICVEPFDACCGIPDEASRRLARNTQVILKLEALLARVADPAGGSYCIEVMTDSIAQKAWRVLREIEAAGGYRRAVAEGMIGSMLEQRKTAQNQASKVQQPPRTED